MDISMDHPSAESSPARPLSLDLPPSIFRGSIFRHSIFRSSGTLSSDYQTTAPSFSNSPSTESSYSDSRALVPDLISISGKEVFAPIGSTLQADSTYPRRLSTRSRGTLFSKTSRDLRGQSKYHRLRRRAVLLILALLGLLIVVLSILLGLSYGLNRNRPAPSLTSTSNPTTTTSALNNASTDPSSTATTPPQPSDADPTTDRNPSIPPISTSSTPQSPVPTSGVLPLDCPAIDGKTTTRKFYDQTWNFTQYCNKDIAPVAEANIIAIMTYTFPACLDACSAYNIQHSSLGKPEGCNAVVFIGNLTAWALLRPANSKSTRIMGNCFLKNSTAGGLVQRPVTDVRAMALAQTESTGPPPF